MFQITIGDEMKFSGENFIYEYITDSIVWIRQISFGSKTFIAACLEKDAQGIFFNETYYTHG